MEKFDIQEVIKHYNPDIEELSRVLFPHIKYPKQAFDRIIRGEANLDTVQVEALANYLGVLPSDLFTTDGWKGGWDKSNNCLTFTKDNYRVNINYGGTFITAYKDGKVINQELKASVDKMTVTEFIQYINKLIN